MKIELQMGLCAWRNIKSRRRRTPVECKVDTVETVDSLPQINDNSRAYKRPLAVTWSFSTPAEEATIQGGVLSWKPICRNIQQQVFFFFFFISRSSYEMGGVKR